MLERKKHSFRLRKRAGRAWEKGTGQQLYECPICGLVCANYQILQEHVDLHLEEHHFSQGINVSGLSDLELAQQLQNEEDKQQELEEARREREEFQKLQVL
nr:zinc finger with UFM1-specific peptidase domain protein-like [Pelodiscus sinensis]|eukprot:XP_025040429.1 zinc finger with UFM1-specific peptidase domain protein-like [Pelodiscus sinensis]